MSRKYTDLSKFISLILRHKPDVIKVDLDKNGWCNIDELIQGINNSGRNISRNILLDIVKNDSKQRYSIDSLRNRIRANQGHSISVDINYELREPPAKLYHGTVGKFINSIKTEGLIKGQRQYVHLSEKRETAIQVGKRRGTPIILEIDTKSMHIDGFTFYISENEVWLCEHVPSQYISISQVE